jgi:hypothetical protein
MSTRRTKKEEMKESPMTETQMQLSKECSTPGCEGVIVFDHLDDNLCPVCRNKVSS